MGPGYPLVLVHGIALRSDIDIMPYFPGVQERLEADGFSVHLANVDAWGSVESNAAQLVREVLAVCEQTGSDKVNLIGHSKGGLDARYAISALGLADKVASLTTIATPHRGCYLADLLMDELAWPKFIAGQILDAISTLSGDERANAMAAASQLSVKAMADFNANIPDMPGVLYQSYAGVIQEDHPHLLWLTLARYLAETEGPNDSVVSLESAKWGWFRGIAGADEPGGVSHLDLTFRHSALPGGTFTAPQFYAEIAADLRRQGY